MWFQNLGPRAQHKSCSFVGRTRGTNMFSIMTIEFFFEGETGYVVDDDDKTKGTCLLELAAMLF